MGVMEQLSPKFMNRVQGMELERLTSQHYNFPARVLTQEGLHEVVSHREKFGGWRDISKYNGEKIIPSGHSLQSQQRGGTMSYVGKFQCPAPDKPSNQANKQPTTHHPTTQCIKQPADQPANSQLPNHPITQCIKQPADQPTTNQFSPTHQPAYQSTSHPTK